VTITAEVGLEGERDHMECVRFFGAAVNLVLNAPAMRKGIGGCVVVATEPVPKVNPWTTMQARGIIGRVFIHFDADRASDSPYIERVWRCHSEGSGPFLSMASSHWEMVVTKLAGKYSVTLHGPESRAREVYCPPDGEWSAVRFKAGTFMPSLPIGNLLDGRDVNLPGAWRGRFRFEGRNWEIPTYENAESFVERLARHGIIQRDAAVTAALEGDELALTRRSAQRHFHHAVGMTYTAHRQIERARRATFLLRAGASPAEAAFEAGFFDQPHLTRSLRRLVGLTPARIARAERQLSFLYKT
jgi:AraC-like DNA-binding protein